MNILGLAFHLNKILAIDNLFYMIDKTNGV